MTRWIVSFDDDDPDNPVHWSTAKKLRIELSATILILNSISSGLASTSKAAIGIHFNITDPQMLVLPTSAFLIGFIFGPLVFAPTSERHGRRWVLIAAFLLYSVFTLATALAPNWAAFVVFRFWSGFFVSGPLSVSGGLYADLHKDPVQRGRVIARFMVVASLAPAAGAAVAGYLATISWRWPFWFALVFAGVSAPFVLSLPETYAPILLKHRARSIRRKDPDAWAPIELESAGPMQFVRKYLNRPLRMLCTEPIVTFSCIYLCLIYVAFFLFLQAFAVIFEVYHFTTGELGLAFIPVVIGCILAMPFYLYWDHYLRVASSQGKAWTAREEYRRLPLAMLGGPLLTISLFWIGWSARSGVHWIVPMLGGAPFGIGFVLIFMALFNYMADAYGIYSASALAASNISRSVFGVVLPFATRAMFGRLGVAWACSLLGFVSLGMCLIPFAFVRFGARIRRSSRLCQELAAGNSIEHRPERASEETVETA